jgi:hypothetical protein
MLGIAKRLVHARQVALDDALAALVMQMKTFAPSGDFPASFSQRIFLGDLCISWRRSPGLKSLVIRQFCKFAAAECCATATGRRGDRNGNRIRGSRPSHPRELRPFCIGGAHHTSYEFTDMCNTSLYPLPLLLYEYVFEAFFCTAITKPYSILILIIRKGVLSLAQHAYICTFWPTLFPPSDLAQTWGKPLVLVKCRNSTCLTVPVSRFACSHRLS